MKSFLSLLALALVASSSLFAQPSPIPTKIFEPDTLQPENIVETKGSLFMELEGDPIETQLDAFVKNYHFSRPTSSLYDTLLLNTYSFRPGDVPQYSPQVIQQRLREIPAIIPMDYNDHVQRYIDLYTIRRRDQVSRMMGLSEVYFPLFEEYLDRNGMPIEIKYLAVVESALNPHAVSRVGATGLWQFMLGTARMYNLRVNSYVDERKDPVKSTLAAIKYLKGSYEEFGDWLLAIASYNCGPGNVRKAILRSGGKKTFWEVMPYLPQETRGYVPAFIAAAYTFEYASENNLYPLYVDLSLSEDTVQIRNMDISLQDISRMTGADLQLLRTLNPELKIDRIPYSSETYILRVPRKVGEYFASYPATIRSEFGQKSTGYVAAAPVSTQVTATSTRTTGTSSSSAAAPRSNTKLVYHTVRSGEVVGAIADRYNVTPRQVAEWNHLRRYQIKVGQKLKIYVPARSKSSASTSETSGQIQALTHTVRSGETLWGIASLYPGVEVNSLISLNNSLDVNNLKVGQVIRVR
ncbi:MAG: LysM peptidoglycan-binding domain-containing protein [Bacteroidetes bacterium]|nr:MAG: LysM peptidoglycan-binding domain-containing protein [Bacteroidota bacterium]